MCRTLQPAFQKTLIGGRSAVPTLEDLKDSGFQGGSEEWHVAEKSKELKFNWLEIIEARRYRFVRSHTKLVLQDWRNENRKQVRWKRKTRGGWLDDLATSITCAQVFRASHRRLRKVSMRCFLVSGFYGCWTL